MSKSKIKVKNWRSCTGVNSRTGRIRRGFRAAKGRCPVQVQNSFTAVEAVSATGPFITSLGRARR